METVSQTTVEEAKTWEEVKAAGKSILKGLGLAFLVGGASYVGAKAGAAAAGSVASEGVERIIGGIGG